MEFFSIRPWFVGNTIFRKICEVKLGWIWMGDQTRVLSRCCRLGALKCPD